MIDFDWEGAGLGGSGQRGPKSPTEAAIVTMGWTKAFAWVRDGIAETAVALGEAPPHWSTLLTEAYREKLRKMGVEVK